MGRRVVVIGGNAAGLTAASRARRLDEELDILVLEASSFISYSICGLPYLVSGDVEDHAALIRFDPERLLEERGIRALTGCRVCEIMPGRRALRYLEVATGEEHTIPYERLVVATGYKARVPPFAAVDLEGLVTVSRLEHGIHLRRLARSSKQAVVVGGGYVGLMMVEALSRAGLGVTLIERERQIFRQVDEDLASLLQQELVRHGVRVLLETSVREVLGQGGRVRGVDVGQESLACDLLLVDVGVAPNTDLAAAAGFPLGMSGGIRVDLRGQTELAGVYAAGNCAETVHLVTGKPVFSALGTTAAKQGRVVGENLAGLRTEFPGTLETSIEKVFGLSVGRTGLTSQQAFECGFEVGAVRVTDRDRSPYYAGSGSVDVKLVFERGSFRLLGGQIVGQDQAAKRIDTLVAALSGRLTLRDLAGLDLAYAPPFGTLWDPIQIAANQALRGQDLHRVEPG